KSSVAGKLHYWLTLLSGLVESLFVMGIVFGWASLVFVLKGDGYFRAWLPISVLVHPKDCSSQDEHFSQVMSVASIPNTIIRFPIGYIFDSCGTTATRLISISLYITGTLLITLSNADMLFFIIGNLFDSYRSTIITIYSGAYDSSAAVLLIIKMQHEGGVSLHTSFLFLTSCSIIYLFHTFLLMPKGHIPYPLQETYTYGSKQTAPSILI
uniref:Uncharacterized protein n=1 Tax=Lates calcarifer TaxID=8187 RepID=A0A4W6DGU9_LATCA